ncbi:hypothetical protein ACTXT7_013234 [Hymenolepis weldensis]
MLSSTHRPSLLSDKQLSFPSPYISLWAPINQDLNMAESLDPNCKRPFKTTNSAAEFDTDLLQTDIRELFQELPEHADDSNPVQDGIHDFLPEQADKRKRKTPKSTASPNTETPNTSFYYGGSQDVNIILTTLIHCQFSNFIISILQKRSPSTCQPLHNLHRRLLNFKPSTRNCSPQSYQKQHSRANIILAVNNKSKSSMEQ